jgi:threonine 3-dehydrogenase
MKALIKKKPEKGIWLDEAPVPTIGINDVLVKIKKTAICGTDLHIYKWDEWAQKTIHPPMIIGHEYVGTVVEVGSGVTNVKVGERVTGEGHIACNQCRNCKRGKKHICENTVGVGVNRDGAFAEYVAIPAFNIIMLNSKISDDLVAIFDPLGNATHAALSFPLIGEDVLVTGAGLIGSMAVAISRFAGARYVVVTDLNEYRLDIARKMGPTKAINPRKEKIADVVKALDMVGFDVGLEMSGSPAAFNEMIHNMYNGGKIALLGILPSSTLIPWDKVIFKALRIKGIYGREMFETWYTMEQMVLSGLDVSPIITHRFPVDDYQKAFDIMETGNCGKIILNWE